MDVNACGGRFAPEGITNPVVSSSCGYDILFEWLFKLYRRHLRKIAFQIDIFDYTEFSVRYKIPKGQPRTLIPLVSHVGNNINSYGKHLRL